MTKAIQIGASISSVVTSTNTVQYWQVHGAINGATAEANAQMLIDTAGTISSLRIRITSNSIATGNTSNFNFRKNGANGNQVVAVPGASTGIFVDSTNTDTVAIGDLIDVMSTPGATTGGMGITIFACVFDTGGSSTVSRMVYGCATGQSGNTTSSGTFFPPLMGTITFNSTLPNVEATAQALQRDSGTFRNLGIKISSNSRSTVTDTLVFRKNGADGNQTVPISPSTTGILEDNTHTDTVVAGDLVCYSLRNGASSSARTWEYFSSEFVTTTNPGTGQICSTPISSTAVTAVAGTARFIPIGGGSPQGATESATQVTVYDAYTFHDLSINMTVNTVAGSGTLILRQNGSNSTLSVPITGATTGWFTDQTHTVTTTSGDLINLQITGGSGSGTINYGCTSLFADIAGVGPTVCTVTAKTVTNKFIVKA